MEFHNDLKVKNLHKAETPYVKQIVKRCEIGLSEALQKGDLFTQAKRENDLALSRAEINNRLQNQVQQGKLF